MTTTTEDTRRDEHNAAVSGTLRQAREGRGYAAVVARGEKIHAAMGATQGHGGFIHPRPVCMNATSLVYAALTSDPHGRDVTCKRCLAGLAKRNVI